LHDTNLLFNQIMKPSIKPTLTIFLFFFFSNGYTQFWKTKRVVGNGNLTTETTTTSDYDQLKSVGFMDVELFRGTEGKIVVKNNTLILDTNNVNLKTKKGIHIKVPFEELSSITLVGSGDIYSTHPLGTSKFETTLIGSGDIKYKGEPNQKEIRVFGSGNITNASKQ
jgi:hypothetical protein